MHQTEQNFSSFGSTSALSSLETWQICSFLESKLRNQLEEKKMLQYMSCFLENYYDNNNSDIVFCLLGYPMSWTCLFGHVLFFGTMMIFCNNHDSTHSYKMIMVQVFQKATKIKRYQASLFFLLQKLKHVNKPTSTFCI
jgi:hypothetical protein